MMQFDGIFRPAYKKLVCQDYIVWDKQKMVVSDGCSSGRRVDVGARVLAHATLTALSKEGVKGVMDCLGLKLEDMLATLLTIHIPENKPQAHECLHIIDLGIRQRIVCQVAGDGFLIFKNSNQKEFTYQVAQYEYKQNAPFYPIYDIMGKTVKWRDAIPDNECVITEIMYDENWKEVKRNTASVKNASVFTVISPIEGTEWVAAATDGLTSFVGIGDAPIELSEVLKSIFSFKNYTGEFVKRRVLAAEKDWEKAGWKHMDDIGVGVIHVKEYP